MKKLTYGLVVVLFLACIVAGDSLAQGKRLEVVEVEKNAGTETFSVYTEKWAKDNHFFASGWMGDYGDIEINEGYITNAHSGKTCMKITYKSGRSQGAGWVGVYWQNPPNNWGDQMGGYDLTGYKKLTFWARGQKGGEVISKFSIGGISGMYSDSDSTAMGPVTLTKAWKEYSIDLKGLDLSYISGGFGFSISINNNPEGVVFYLDDMNYEK